MPADSPSAEVGVACCDRRTRTNAVNKILIIWMMKRINYRTYSFPKGKGRTLDIAPQVDIATTKALRYMAHTKQRRMYLPYTFPAIAGTHLPTPRGRRVE